MISKSHASASVAGTHVLLGHPGHIFPLDFLPDDASGYFT